MYWLLYGCGCGIGNVRVFWQVYVVSIMSWEGDCDGCFLFGCGLVCCGCDVELIQYEGVGFGQFVVVLEVFGFVIVVGFYVGMEYDWMGVGVVVVQFGYLFGWFLVLYL